MKIISLFCLISIVSFHAFSQSNCCSRPNATQLFAMLTSDENFVKTHLDPLPFRLENPIGTMISFKCLDGKVAHAYEIKAKVPSQSYVFVIHEWWGLNDYIKKESEEIYNRLSNVNVIAIDLYDQRIATTKDSAAKYMQMVKIERAESIIKGAISHVGKDAKIATIGWCFGGGWSMQATLLAGKQSKACVMYYGAPEENATKIAKLNAPILFIWPTQDQWINREMLDKFESNMNVAQKQLEVRPYEADHAFANPSNPKYSKSFADDAFYNAMNFIKLNLK